MSTNRRIASCSTVPATKSLLPGGLIPSAPGAPCFVQPLRVRRSQMPRVAPPNRRSHETRELRLSTPCRIVIGRRSGGGALPKRERFSHPSSTNRRTEFRPKPGLDHRHSGFGAWSKNSPRKPDNGGPPFPLRKGRSTPPQKMRAKMHSSGDGRVQSGLQPQPKHWHGLPARVLTGKMPVPQHARKMQSSDDGRF